MASNNVMLILCFQALRAELQEREQLVLSTLDQARMFLADQPIEGPEEPRKNMQSKKGGRPLYSLIIIPNVLSKKNLRCIM